MTIKTLGRLLLSLLLGGCVALPQGVTPVGDFESDRYLGTWFEIARLDHPFERGLSRVTADYSMRDDGGLRVVNRGFKEATQEMKEAVGKAYFVASQNLGQLKVSFFGPFYGGYNIIALDKRGYRWAMVCGPDKDYLWILSRKPALAPDILGKLVKQAAAYGFATDKLIFVDHND